VSPHYDPLIAQILAYGPDRKTAWYRLSQALAATVVHGPVTNLDFLRELLSREDVIDGEYHTGFLEETFVPERKSRLEAEGADLLAVGTGLADRFGLAGDGSSRAGSETGEERRVDPFELGSWRHPGLRNE
jgi:acetyl/propionyl-CoA carboxylase alpha subunit